MSKTLVAVLQPSGVHSHFVSPVEADRMLERAKVFAIRKQGLLIAVRLKSVKFADDSRLMKLDRRSRSALQGTPVINCHELLAPSPRHHWGFKVAVYDDLRKSPQRPRPNDLRDARERWAKVTAKKLASE